MKGKQAKIVKDCHSLSPSFYFAGDIGEVVKIVGGKQVIDSGDYIVVETLNVDALCTQYIPLECLRYLNNKQVK